MRTSPDGPIGVGDDLQCEQGCWFVRLPDLFLDSSANEEAPKRVADRKTQKRARASRSTGVSTCFTREPGSTVAVDSGSDGFQMQTAWSSDVQRQRQSHYRETFDHAHDPRSSAGDPSSDGHSIRRLPPFRGSHGFCRLTERTR